MLGYVPFEAAPPDEVTLESLSDESLSLILSFLSAETLFAVSQVSRLFRSLALHEFTRRRDIQPITVTFGKETVTYVYQDHFLNGYNLVYIFRPTIDAFKMPSQYRHNHRELWTDPDGIWIMDRCLRWSYYETLSVQGNMAITWTTEYAVPETVDDPTMMIILPDCLIISDAQDVLPLRKRTVFQEKLARLGLPYWSTDASLFLITGHVEYLAQHINYAIGEELKKVYAILDCDAQGRNYHRVRGSSPTRFMRDRKRFMETIVGPGGDLSQMRVRLDSADGERIIERVAGQILESI
ncbi:hypothetical protein HDU85_000962 [Gaertneriomyces sp. JEL0708]|nr:hypothetical protein HDU85_000962 [Gaertneriomyces sp. JEL0708]